MIVQHDHFLDLAGMLKQIQGFYLQFETEESAKRKSALVDIIHSLNNDGIEGTALISGSLSMGMSVRTEEEDSDIDLFFSWQTSRFLNHYEIHNMFYDEIYKQLWYNVKIDFSVPFDIEFIKLSLSEFQAASYDYIGKFYAKYKSCQPVTDSLLPLVERLDELRQQNFVFDQYLKTSALHGFHWERSFGKYHERLLQRGISIPDEESIREKVFIEMYYLCYGDS